MEQKASDLPTTFRPIAEFPHNLITKTTLAVTEENDHRGSDNIKQTIPLSDDLDFHHWSNHRPCGAPVSLHDLLRFLQSGLKVRSSISPSLKEAVEQLIWVACEVICNASLWSKQDEFTLH